MNTIFKTKSISATSSSERNKQYHNYHYLTDIMEQTKLVCPLCGGNLTNQGQDLASNIRMEYQGDSEAKVRYFVCGKCHRDYEIFDPVNPKGHPKSKRL